MADDSEWLTTRNGRRLAGGMADDSESEWFLPTLLQHAWPRALLPLLRCLLNVDRFYPWRLAAPRLGMAWLRHEAAMAMAMSMSFIT